MHIWKGARVQLLFSCLRYRKKKKPNHAQYCPTPLASVGIETIRQSHYILKTVFKNMKTKSGQIKEKWHNLYERALDQVKLSLKLVTELN